MNGKLGLMQIFGLSEREIFSRIWVWLCQGMSIVAIPMAILSLTCNISELIILKGMPAPSYPDIALASMGMIGSLIWIGYIWYKKKIQEDVLTYMNTQGNKQNVDAFRYYEEIKKGNEEIKKILERNGMK